MGPTWILSATDGPHVGPMNLAIRVYTLMKLLWWNRCNISNVRWQSKIHKSPSQANFEMLALCILAKIDAVIMELHRSTKDKPVLSNRMKYRHEQLAKLVVGYQWPITLWDAITHPCHSMLNWDVCMRQWTRTIFFSDLDLSPFLNRPFGDNQVSELMFK